MFSQSYRHRILSAVLAASVIGASLLTVPVITAAPAQAADANADSPSQAAIMRGAQVKLNWLDHAIRRKMMFIQSHPNTQEADLTMIEMQQLIQERQQTIAMMTQLAQAAQQPVTTLQIGR